MYLGRTERRTKNGGSVGYLALAHNVWDPVSKQSRVRSLYSFGREDQLDCAAIERLIGSLQRALGPGQALASVSGGELVFVLVAADGRRVGAGRAVAEPRDRP
jgi:hypothetical protein